MAASSDDTFYRCHRGKFITASCQKYGHCHSLSSSHSLMNSHTHWTRFTLIDFTFSQPPCGVETEVLVPQCWLLFPSKQWSAPLREKLNTIDPWVWGGADNNEVMHQASAYTSCKDSLLLRGMHTHINYFRPPCCDSIAIRCLLQHPPYLPCCRYRQPFAPLGAWGGIDIQLKPTALSGVQGVAHELCMSWRQGAEQHQCHHNWNNWEDNARWVNN